MNESENLNEAEWKLHFSRILLKGVNFTQAFLTWMDLKYFHRHSAAISIFKKVYVKDSEVFWI